MPPVSFARGAPSPECLDPDLIVDCAQAALARDGRTILAYGPGGGYGPLREVLAERHGVTPERVFLTAGGLQGFVHYLAVQLARRPGRVLVEGPTYDRPLRLLRLHGVEVEALPMDEEGLDVDALETELDRGGEVSFLYTIPTFQNPTGRTLGLERRRRLAALAADRGPDVLEGGERVTFTSSFSKTVAPGLRVAWFVVPEGLVAAYDDRVVSTSITPPLLPQAVVHELLSRGAFEPNLERIRRLLRPQRDAMLAALAAELPDGVSWNEPQGGYFLWISFGVDAAELQERAAGDVAFVKGADFFPGGERGTREARLAFSYEPPERIAEGVRRLARLLS